MEKIQFFCRKKDNKCIPGEYYEAILPFCLNARAPNKKFQKRAQNRWSCARTIITSQDIPEINGTNKMR